jgi:hypothetical protein
MDYAGSQIRDTIDRPVTLSETRSPDVAIHVRRHSIGQVLEVRFGYGRGADQMRRRPAPAIIYSRALDLSASIRRNSRVIELIWVRYVTTS